jgi:hypothetical protein
LSEPWKKPGDTYFLARSNIIGGTCLTTVFGMGTGMAKCLWSPGMLVVSGALAPEDDLSAPERGLVRR